MSIKALRELDRKLLSKEKDRHIEILTAQRDELLAALKWVTETQKRNYGNATNLHIDMLDWQKKYRGLIEKYRA